MRLLGLLVYFGTMRMTHGLVCSFELPVWFMYVVVLLTVRDFWEDAIDRASPSGIASVVWLVPLIRVCSGFLRVKSLSSNGVV